MNCITKYNITGGGGRVFSSGDDGLGDQHELRFPGELEATRSEHGLLFLWEVENFLRSARAIRAAGSE